MNRCADCIENGCYPDVCRCDCHPTPIGWRARLRKTLGISKNPPGTKGWRP